MPHLADGAVDLVVTSPPYWNARAYDTYAHGTGSHKERSYTKGFADGSYASYLALMTRCFAELFRTLKPGGVCCVNVASVLFEGKTYPIPADLTGRLVDLGYEVKEELVWDKCHAACNRFGNFARRPLPHLYYPNLSSERVLVLRKPGPKPPSMVSEQQREASKLPLSTLATTEISGDVWHIAAERAGRVKHCAPFPQDLVARLVLLYSYRGDCVLDPFTGSAQTMVVANAYGRRFVGVDVEQQFVDYARSRVGEPISVRRKQLRPRYEHILDDPFLTAQLVDNVDVDGPERSQASAPRKNE